MRTNRTPDLADASSVTPPSTFELVQSFLELTSLLKRHLLALREITRYAPGVSKEITEATANMSAAQDMYDEILEELDETIPHREEDCWYEFAVVEHSLTDALPPLTLAVDVLSQELKRFAGTLLFNVPSLDVELQPPGSAPIETKASYLLSQIALIESTYDQLNVVYQVALNGNHCIFENLASFDNRPAVVAHTVFNTLLSYVPDLVAPVEATLAMRQNLLDVIEKLHDRRAYLTEQLLVAEGACKEGSKMLTGSQLKKCKLNSSIAVHATSAYEILKQASSLLEYSQATEAEKKVLFEIGEMLLTLITFREPLVEGVLRFIDTCCTTHEHLRLRADSAAEGPLFSPSVTSVNTISNECNEYRPLVITPSCIKVQPVYQESHLRQIAELNNQAKQAFPTLEELQRHMRLCGAKAFIALLGQRVAASITFTITANEAKITSMTVAEDLRDQGIGRRLLEEFLPRWLTGEKRTIAACFAHSVSINQGFLIKMGFEEGAPDVANRGSNSSLSTTWRYKR
jgi:GNAT superfamily N-acetyltransferase